MRCKEEVAILYVKIRVCAKIGGFGKAMEWQLVFAPTRKFTSKVSLDGRAADETQAININVTRENMCGC